ncbi:hypothetical protein [Polyangium sp. y55x31]|uniref:hypothetical protein n=1 Tax=Polyangium sp. y55x31 TaxID=3042688 RepID=UPI002482C603|nr:hypothetical protein [Polyangium sp. y55x31]MDI1482748.1 hypothetical protein [Polyangium sp. y55x31]
MPKAHPNADLNGRPTVLLASSGYHLYREYLLRMISRAARVFLLLDRQPSWERSYIANYKIVDTLDAEAMITAAREIMARLPIDGVICWDEIRMVHAARVAQALGVHGAGEGAFGPTSLPLRQTASPPHLLGRINAVQRLLLWGTVLLGSLIASLAIKFVGLRGAVWIGVLGTCLCLPVLLRRGIRDGLVQRWAAARGRVFSPCPSTPTGAPSAPEED